MTDPTPPSPAAGVIIGVDTGGTFTDVTLLDTHSGQVWTAKTPSTPADPSQGFATGIAEALAAAGRTGADVARVLHGTTVATNLILEGKGSKTALITTTGFKYVMEIGRQDVPRRASLFAWVKPKRPVPPEHIHEVGGRMDHRGHELSPLDEAAVTVAARDMQQHGIQSIAVVLLHAYANPAHERRVGEILARLMPTVPVSLSCDVLPVFREYERSTTTVLNASVKPVVSTYVERLDQRLLELGIKAPLLLMKSSGGVTSTRTVRRVPVETALSGPAAGTVGATRTGQSSGLPNLIGIDIGGTSADISLIHGGMPALTMHGQVGGWPVGLPMIDIVTIGAGGGSIASITPAGTLKVGPESAGAAPGPVCYGRGGSEPTVTDAHVALGHLPPFLLDGRFKLDASAARAAIKRRIADPLSLTIEAAARGILAIVDSNMVGAIRVVSVERGHDPRAFALLPFGGAGPLHGGALARLLGMSTIVIPPGPGVLSALGLLVSDLKAEFTRTQLQRAGQIDAAALAGAFATLDAQAQAWLVGEGVPPAARAISWHASLRYRNQGFELFVPWACELTSEAATANAIEAFHRLHERLYTFAQPDTPVEIVTLRVDARGAFPAPHARDVPPSAPIRDAQRAVQTMHLADGPAEAPVYDRLRLGVGAKINGPAILTQLDATTLILPGQEATVDRRGNLIIVEAR
ncbi:MAG: hydantoinase/oxoprolinase family protein [Hyphomicrobiaceae bacterium]